MTVKTSPGLVTPAEYQRELRKTTEPQNLVESCPAVFETPDGEVIKCWMRLGHFGGHDYRRPTVESALGQIRGAPGETCVFPMVGGTHSAHRAPYTREAVAFANSGGGLCGVNLCVLRRGHEGDHRPTCEAQSDKSSPVDDIQAYEPSELCGCEQSVSLTERVELLETLLWDLSVVAGFKGAHVERDIVEHVRQLAENCATADRSGEIASLTRALEAERRANSEAVPRLAALALHNRMLLGLVEGMAREAPRAPASAPSALARARSLCAEGLEFTYLSLALARVAAGATAEVLGAAALRKLGDALGWAAVGTY